MQTRIERESNLLSGLDAAFLYLERKEIPLNIAMICVFESALPFEKFIADVESKLHLLPRFGQIAVAPRFNIGYPSWEPDPDFDIRRHIFPVRLEAPGGDAELEALAGSLLGRLIDRGKPLWEIHVVRGLRKGRGALIVRIHHSMADGVSGVAAITGVMLDRTPEPGPNGRPPDAVPCGPLPKRPIWNAVAGAIYNTLSMAISVEHGVLSLVAALGTGAMWSGLAGAARLLPEMAGAVERLPFNKRCTGARKFCWMEIDLSEVQAIRKAAGGTVNDVILSVLTRAIARYTEWHGQSVGRRLIRVVCPVSLRQDEGGTGNCISLLPVVLPLDIADPVSMLQAVSVRMQVMKNIRAADMMAVAGACMAAFPPAVQAAAWWAVPQLTLPLPLLNMICTNVPGSREPVYSLGRRMIAFYPQVPTGYELGINCAVTSYAGKLFVGLIADSHAAPDVNVLRDFLHLAFRELRLSAGVERTTPPRAGQSRSKRPVANAGKVASSTAGRSGRIAQQTRRVGDSAVLRKRS